MLASLIMKLKSNSPLCILLGALILVPHSNSVEGAPAVGGGPGWNLALNRLFGSVEGFIADTEIRMFGADGQELLHFPGIRFLLLDESVRVEMDLTRVKSAQMPPGAMESMGRMGMDKMINVMVPERKTVLMIYPSLESFVEMPIPQEQYAVAPEDYQLDRTPLGTEEIDGETYEKSKVILTDPKGITQEVLVWTGQKPKDFPVQLQFAQGDQVVVMRHRNVKVGRPEEALFKAPSNYTRHTDLQSLMQTAMQRMLESRPSP
jgi:hypothetical protein